MRAMICRLPSARGSGQAQQWAAPPTTTDRSRRGWLADAPPRAHLTCFAGGATLRLAPARAALESRRARRITAGCGGGGRLFRRLEGSGSRGRFASLRDFFRLRAFFPPRDGGAHHSLCASRAVLERVDEVAAQSAWLLLQHPRCKRSDPRIAGGIGPRRWRCRPTRRQGSSTGKRRFCTPSAWPDTSCFPGT